LTSFRAPSRQSLRGLDWFVFFLADVQTGFGPFITVYLTAQAWTQTDIGLVLTAGSLVALLGQMPGGAIVDAARSEKFVAALSIAAIAASALLLAAAPIFPAVLLSQVVYSLNMAALAVLSLLISRHIARRPSLLHAPVSPAVARAGRLRAISVLAISVAAVPMAMMWPGSGQAAFLLMLPVLPLSKRLERAT